MFRRKPLIDGAIRRRFVVTLTGGEGAFGGVLTESDSETLVFEQCQTVPGPGQTPDAIAGRVFVDRISVAYLQEIAA